MTLNVSKTNRRHQPRRNRALCGTLVFLASAVALTGDASALAPQLPRMISQSNSFATTNTPRNPLQSSVLEKPRIKDLSRGPAKTNKDRRNRKDHPDDENKKKRKNNEKWRLLIYDDKVNTRDRVARVLVEVTGSSEVEAFRITNEAHDTGVAVVGTSFPLEIAEAYNERLRREGITSEIRLVERYGGDIGNWE